LNISLAIIVSFLRGEKREKRKEGRNGSGLRYCLPGKKRRIGKKRVVIRLELCVADAPVLDRHVRRLRLSFLALLCRRGGREGERRKRKGTATCTRTAHHLVPCMKDLAV